MDNKVFSWKAYMHSMIEAYDSYEEFQNNFILSGFRRDWVKTLEGLTKYEIEKIGYKTNNGWMIEKED